MKDFITDIGYPCACGQEFKFSSMSSNVYACTSCNKLNKRNPEMEIVNRPFGPTEINSERSIGTKVSVDSVEYVLKGKALVQTSDFKFWWYSLQSASTKELAVIAEFPFGSYFFHWSLIQSNLDLRELLAVDKAMNLEGKAFHVLASFSVDSVAMLGEIVWPGGMKTGRWCLMGGVADYSGLLIQTKSNQGFTLVDKVPGMIQWDPQKESVVTTLTCSKCNEVSELKSGALAFRFGCPSCHHTFDLSKGHVELLGPWVKEFRPILKIGGKVQLNNTGFSVIGMVVREIIAYQVNWKEYQLLSNDGTHACLVEMNGHWTLSVLDQRLPYFKIGNSLPHSFNFEGKPYKLFSRDYVDIAYTEGESLFKWDDHQLYVDFIAPPVGLTFENHGSYRLNYRNSYIKVGQVKKSAELARAIPPTYGVGPLSERLLPTQSKFWYRVLALYMFAFFIHTFVHYWTCRNEKIYHNTIPIQLEGTTPASDANSWGDNGNSGYDISPTFTVSESSTNLKVFLYAPVMQNWANFEVVLVNENTGKQDVFYADVEFYSGVDDGGSWAEGSQKTNFFISRVEAGRYHTEVRCTQNVPSDKFGAYTVFEDVIITSNAIVVLIGIAVLLGGLSLVHMGREKKRFSNSEYSPYDE